MLDLGELAARVHIDDRAVPGELNAVHRRFGSFSTRIEGDARRAGERAGSNLGQSFHREASRGISRFSLAPALGMITRFGAAGATALGAVGGAGLAMGVQIAAGNENADIAFTTMLGSGRKAKAFLDDLKGFAASTPFEFPELQTAASSLISAGVNAKNVIPIMTSLGNATSGMGTGAEGVKRATVALQQMNAAGRITAEDLNQLRDAGIPVYDLLAKATGKSKKEIAELAQTGKLGRKELEQMMTALAEGKGLERFDGLMQKQSASLNGMWSTVKDTIGQGLATAIAPVIPLLKDGLGGAAEVAGRVLKQVPPAIDWIITAGKGLYSVLAEHDYTKNLRESFGWLEDSSPVDVLLDLSEGFGELRDQARAWWAATKSKEAGPLRDALSSIGDSLYRLSPFFDNAASSTFGLSKAFPILTRVVHAGVRGVELLAQGLEYLVEHRGQVLEFLTPIGAAFKSLWDQLRNIDMGTVRAAIGSVAEAIGKLGPMLTDFLASLPAIQPTLDAMGVGFRFVADHMDLVGKALPYLIAGFAAYKAAQAANNVVGKDSLVGFALQLGSTIALTVANWQLARSLRGVEGATATSTAVENVGALSRIRGAAATVASTVASKAAAAASKVWAAGQWVLNAALTANPIGLVVVAIGLLVGALIYAYRHSSRFRAIVQSVFGWFRDWVPKAFGAVVSFIKDGWAKITGFFSAASSWVRGTWRKGWGAVSGAISGAVDKGREQGHEALDKLRGRFSSAKTWALGTFKRQWGPVSGVLSGAISKGREAGDEHLTRLRGRLSSAKDWAVGAFKRGWAAVGKVLSDPVGAGRDAVTSILGTNNSTGLRGRFWKTVDALGAIWDRLKAKMKAPIVSVIGIINTGLIGAYNWVIDKLKLGDKFKGDPIKIKGFRTGGATSYTGSDDQVAGVVHGNEHVWTAREVRAAGGHARVAAMRKAAVEEGDHAHLPGFAEGGAAFANPSGRTSMDGKSISRIAAAQIKLAEEVSGIAMRVMQGGFGGSHVAASGTSHNYPGVADLSPGSIRQEKILRQVGFASWARNVAGRSRVGSGAHNHAASLLDPGNRGSAQIRFSWPGHGNGLSGRNNDPAPHYAWLPNLRERLGASNLVGIGGGGDGGGGAPVKASWLGKFANPAALLADRARSAMDKAGLGRLGSEGWEGAVKAAPGRLLSGVLEKVKGFASSLWHTASGAVGGVVSKIGDVATGGSNRARGLALMLAAGFGPAQFVPLNKLWTRESGWNHKAVNRSSGAYGIPQSLPGSKMGSVAGDWRTNPNTQIRWGLGYIKDRYGSPSKAWAHSQAHNWYGDGTASATAGVRGVAERGPELVVNPQLRKFRGGEKVLNARQTAEHLGGGDDRPYIGNLTLQSSGNVHQDLAEVSFNLRTISRGGVHA